MLPVAIELQKWLYGIREILKNNLYQMCFQKVTQKLISR